MPSGRFAERRDVEDQVARWDDDVLQCRTYGHPWRPARATLNRRGFYRIVEVCPRCTAERTYEMSTRGEVFGTPSIRYPEGYLSKGLGRIAGDARGAVRLAAVVRVFPVTRLSAAASEAEQPRFKGTRDALRQSEKEAS